MSALRDSDLVELNLMATLASNLTLSRSLAGWFEAESLRNPAARRLWALIGDYAMNSRGPADAFMPWLSTQDAGAFRGLMGHLAEHSDEIIPSEGAVRLLAESVMSTAAGGDFLAKMRAKLVEVEPRLRRGSAEEQFAVRMELAGIISDFRTTAPSKEQKVAHVPTPFRQLNHMLQGGVASHGVVVIGGSAGSGKSSLGLNLLVEMAKARDTTGTILSLEMTEAECDRRITSSMTQVPAFEFFGEARDSEHEFRRAQAHRHRAVMEEKGHRVSIQADPSMSIERIKGTISMFAMTGYSKVFLVDFIQLIPEGAKKPHQFLGECMSAFQGLCRRYDINIIILSQLNRGKEEDDPLARLAGSSSIGNLADLVLLLDNPRKQERRLRRSVLIPKNRNGIKGTLDLDFMGETYTWADPDD